MIESGEIAVHSHLVPEAAWSSSQWNWKEDEGETTHVHNYKNLEAGRLIGLVTAIWGWYLKKKKKKKKKKK